MNEVLTIVGASGRAAVFSARRAGMKTFVADLFGDADVAAVSAAVRVDDFPRQLRDVARQAPPGPWMFTGGLENHPDLVASIARFKPLWGTPADNLVRIRNPLLVREVLTAAGLPVPQVERHAGRLGRDLAWLEKPLRSCGGAAIRAMDRQEVEQAIAAGGQRRTTDVYYQQRIDGTPAAAAFVAGDKGAHLLGVTRQLVGEAWTGARPFQYCGSVGPWRLPDRLTESIRHIGTTLARAFRLRGLFGVDGIVAGEEFWTVEINPRYTASMEILERASGRSIVGLHAAAFCGGDLEPQMAAASDDRIGDARHAKAIIFAREDVATDQRFSHAVARWNECRPFPAVADVPRSGTAIGAGRPVVTAFADGRADDVVVARLQRRVAEIDAMLRPPMPR